MIQVKKPDESITFFSTSSNACDKTVWKQTGGSVCESKRHTKVISTTCTQRMTRPVPSPPSPPALASARVGRADDPSGRNNELLVALTPAAQMPVTHTQNLCRLPPADFLGPGQQHHFLYFHRPLHGGPRVREHFKHVLLPSPPANRTYHLLIPPDI